jgi:hypothetical protein
MKSPISIVFIALVSVVIGPFAWAVPAGTILFTQAGASILDPSGMPRPAKKGDIVEAGERVVTPSGAVSQILLSDGSLVGMRPGAELKLELSSQPAGRSGQVMTLIQGAVRVIGAELMDPRKPSTLTVQTGLATLKLSAADLESALVKSTDARSAGAPDVGSYSRLLAGTGSIGSGAIVEPLAVRQVSFVGAINLPPVTLASVSPTLFTAMPALTAANLSSLPALAAVGTAPGKMPIAAAPMATTSTLTALAPVGIQAVLAAPAAVASPAASSVASPFVTAATVLPVTTAVVPLQTAIMPAAIMTAITPVATRTSILPAVIKACTNVIINGRMVCI